MASPPQNIGSDAEDGEISASGDETSGKDDVQEPVDSALAVGQCGEENCEDSSPQRKKLKLDISDDANAVMENISSPSSAGEVSAGEDATAEAMEEGETPGKDDGETEKPGQDHDEEEGEEGEILSDSDEDEQPAAATEATSENTSNSKSSEGSSNKKGSSQDYSSRDGRRSPSPRDRYQDRRRHRYSGHSQSPSSSSRNTNSSSGSSSNHLARKGIKRPASNDRRIGGDTRNRKEGSPFTKRKPKMKAPPPSNSPFWGERKHLLPTPTVSPRTGYNLDSDYPQLPRRLVKEYFPDPPIRFVRDSHNFPAADHSKSDSTLSYANKSNKDNDAIPQLSPATLSNDEEAEDMATQECEATMPNLPSMQDLVKNQIYADNNSEMEALPPPLIEDKSLETADTLADVFSEDFPLLDGETPEQEEAISLKKLVAGGSGAIDITIAAGEQKGNLNNKVARQVHKQLSAKKQLKAAAWHSKQKVKQKDNKDHEKSMQPCKYFQNGFCKSGESCPYSHAGPTKIKKKEVCRYYLGDNCTKGDECPYLHETFPCKFFHSRNFCIHGDSCRFSHAPLNDESRELLATVLQQDAKQPGASTPVMSNVNNIADVAQPHPTPQPTPLMSVDTSAMAPLVGGAAPPLMQQDHPPRPPWDGPVPLQPPVMMPPPQFGGGSSSSGPRQLTEPNSSNVMRPPEQKLGILPTPPAYMKLIPDNPQIPAPAMNVNPSINTAVQDPRSSCDPRMNQQQQHLKRQQEQFELTSSHVETSSNETTAGYSKEQDGQTDDDDDAKQTDSTFPLFQPLEPPKELSRQKPHFIPDLPSPSVGVIDNIDANLPSHIARPSNIPHHSIDQSPSRPRNLKSKYSHLKVKSRTSKSAVSSEEQSQLSASKRDSMHKSILKRTTEKPKDPFSIYSQDGTEEPNTGYGEIQPVFSNRTSTKASDSKSSSPDKAANDSDKTATNKDSSVPYYAMFDTGFGSDLQIDSAFGSLED